MKETETVVLRDMNGNVYKRHMTRMHGKLFLRRHTKDYQVATCLVCGMRSGSCNCEIKLNHQPLHFW